jgi:uncharacterized membrane protein YsdA (DUF1294 family)
VIENFAWAGLAYNGFVALLFAYDKWRARRGSSRVPEKTLLLLAAFFGALGALLSMHLVRHKTRKPRFRYGVPFLLFLQVGFVVAGLVQLHVGPGF